MKIFVLGPAGSYGHEVARIAVRILHFTEADLIFQPANISILPAAEREPGIAIVPVENSTYGDVVEVLGYLAKQSPDYPLRIIGQVELLVKHCLLVPQGVEDISELKGIASHPQAIGQCTESVQRWGITNVESMNSTAAAAKYVSEHPEKKFGALASSFAAEIYGLRILAQNVQTLGNNTTRFFIFGRVKQSSPTGKDKTVVIFRIPNEPGTLIEALIPFAIRRISITALHSVSLGNWRYGFYTEIDGHQDKEPLKTALSKMQNGVEMLFVLGSFAR